LVSPLKDTWVTPNYLTTVRLAVGIAAAAAFASGTYACSNLGAALLVVSNFLDHADGELARVSGTSSRIGHFYDLASDGFVTILLFVAIGVGVDATDRSGAVLLDIPPIALALVAGIAVALIFMLRIQIEGMAGKAATRQAMLAGFETEDVLYLMPLVTLCNGVPTFLTAASIGAPLFAAWVVIDYRRALRSREPQSGSSLRQGEGQIALPAKTEANRLVHARVVGIDTLTLQGRFHQQGAFVSLRDFAGPEITQCLIEAVAAVRTVVHRNYIPSHKQGGSVSRHSLDELAPIVGELYRSPALVGWLGELCGEQLLPTPPQDPHAYALYFYTNPGDHIDWHYDTSYYAGRRYTLLLGVIDESSCRLEYQLHTRESGTAVQTGSLQMAPGDLVFFDGDCLRHRITPLGKNEERVSLTFEYVTDPSMRPWWRFISNMKDAIAYFGFRQVFRRTAKRTIP
jgi:phosphatidylglycerophosphate synthase